MADVQIYVLGPVRIERGGAPIHGFESRKAVALLCYVALQGQPQTRAHLAELLWEGKPEGRGRGNLNRVLHNLSALLPGCLAITRQTVGVARGGGLWLDAEAFATMAEQGEGALASAARLYRGDLLADLQIDDCPELEQWVEAAREHWRQRHTQALHRLLRWHADRGDTEQGLAWAAQLLRADPWNEEAHRTTMRLLAQSGQRSAAMAQYEACRRALDDELGIDPEPATLALYEQIRDGVGEGRPAQPGAAQHPGPSHTRRSNLPTPTTSFVDREAELALVLSRLGEASCRLVTLVGPGGVGKSRLALQVALQMEQAHGAGAGFARSVAFVPLAAIEACAWNEAAGSESAAAHALATSIAYALSMAFVGPDTPQSQLLAYLRDQELLLILDNCEQLLAATDLIAQLLQQAPQLKILATSQVRLHIQGEHIVELGGLDVPSEPGPTGSATGYERYGAVKLFTQRARAALPRFALTPANQAEIIQIVQMVDGIPLGIELAASWVRVLTCREIASEIAASLGFLQSARRDLPRRQRSLRAVFDYAWAGLPPESRRALAQLSVFRGGFGREAALQVASAPLPLLAALVDGSLVRCASPAPDASPARYELLEVVRQYAAEQLAEAAPDVAQRHASYYLGMLRQRTADLRGAGQQEALAEIEREIENIRVGWRWAIAHQQVAAVDHAIESLFHFYDMRSWFQEGAAIFAQTTAWLAELAGGSALARRAWGRALARQGWFSFHIGHHRQAYELLAQSIGILRQVGTPADLIFPLHHLAASAAHMGAYADARRLGLEALALGQAADDRYSVAIAKTVLSQIVAPQGQYHEARQLCQESMAIDRAIGNRWGLAFSLLNLGTVAEAMGDHREAQRCFQECLTIREALGDMRGQALCLQHLGSAALALADMPTAQRYYRSSLAMFQAIGSQLGVAATLVKLGYAALAQGDLDVAWEHFHPALQAAWGAQAIPSTLDALGGCAQLLAGSQPGTAAQLAALVLRHPSATRDTSQRASDLLSRLPAAEATAVGAASRSADQQLEEAIALALHGDLMSVC